jgi:hypothetical protein
VQCTSRVIFELSCHAFVRPSDGGAEEAEEKGQEQDECAALQQFDGAKEVVIGKSRLVNTFL